MKKGIGYGLVFFAVFMALWGCTQTDTAADRRSQDDKEHAARVSAATGPGLQIARTITAALAKSAAIADFQDSENCTNVYYACSDTASDDGSNCYNQYQQCLVTASGNGSAPASNVPAACTALFNTSFESEDAAIQAETGCFQALGVCSNFLAYFENINVQGNRCESVYSTCEDTLSNGNYSDEDACGIQDSLCETRINQGLLQTCFNVSDPSQLPEAFTPEQSVQRILQIDACLCGGVGSVFGIDSGLVYRTFKVAVPSNAVGGGFSLSSQAAPFGPGFQVSSHAAVAGKGYTDTSHSAGQGFQAKQP